MKWIKLFEEFQLGDLNFMSPEEIQNLFMRECGKETPDLELIKVILDNGLVDVNSKGEWDNSPLHWAVRKDNLEITKFLIASGADVNAKDIFGRSPLHLADSVEVAKLLIYSGADVNAKDNGGVSPLVWAVYKNNKQIEALLKSHGAIE